jgi:hypothetical protein
MFNYLSNISVRSALASLAVLLVLEVLYLKQSYVAILVSPLVIFILAGIMWLIGVDIFRRKILKLKKLILPIILFLGVSFFMIFESSPFLAQFLIALSLVAFFTFGIFYREIPMEGEGSEKVKDYLNFFILISAFLGYLVVYYLFFYFHLPLWVAMILVAFFSYLLIYYFFWALNISSPIIPLYTVMLSIASVENFFVLSFWRTDPIVRAVVLVVGFYLVLEILSERLRNELAAKSVLEYLAIAGIVLAVTILTMKWYPFY